MAADGTVNINLKLTADTKGGREAEQALGNVEKKASRSIKSMIGGFADAQRAAGRLSTVFNSFLKIGFFAESFNALTGFIDKLTASEHKAKEEAIALADAQKDAADAKRVEKLADAYKKLQAEIADAATARARANELEDMQRTAQDKLEDDSAELEMRDEIAALDADDPLHDKKKEQISARYEADRLRRSVARQRRDANIAEERTWQEREAVAGEATEKEFSLIADREELARLKEEAAAKRAASAEENEFDNNTVAKRFGANLKNILTGNFDKVGDDRSEKGDERRKQLEEEAKALDEKAKAKDAEIKAKEKEVADLNKTADHLAKKAGIQGTVAANAGVAAAAAEVSAKTTTNAADKALADEQAKTEDARRAAALLSQQQAQLKAQIAAEQANKNAAAQNAYSAQNAYDLARANGAPRRDQSAALRNLQSAQGAAQEVAASADGAIAALTATLKSVEARLKAAQTFLKNQNKQNQNAWADAPSGS